MAFRPRLLAQGNLVAAVIAAAALFVFVNYAGFKFWTQWDWTGAGLYTLSPQTRQVVRGLDRDVRIVSFMVESPAATKDVLDQVRSIIDAYEALNRARVHVEWIDPRRDPLGARKLLDEFGIDPLRDPTDVLVVQSGARKKQIRLDDVVEYDMQTNYGGPPPVKSLKVESALTSAIMGITRARQPVVRFAVGHGERQQAATDESGLSRFVAALAQQDIQATEWEALGTRQVPPGTDLIVVPGPSSPWLPPERDALALYLQQNGRVLLLLEPVPLRGASTLAPTGLEPLLTMWGFAADADVVIDPRRAIPFFGPETFYAQPIGLHPVTRTAGGEPILFVLARSLTPSKPAPAGIEVHSLIETSPESWGETDIREQPLAKDDKDRSGPLSVALAAEAKATGTEAAKGAAGRLVAVGDVDLVSNLAFDQMAGNRTFALNAVSWLLEEERALAIPPKDRSIVRLFLTQQQITTMFFVLVIGFPLLAVAAGLAVWSRRRRAD